MLRMTYFGHAAFLLDSGEKRIVVDPFLEGNPHAKVKPSALQVDAVLLTHGHGDHLGDAIQIAKKCQAPIIAPYELACYCQGKGAPTHPMHIGGSRTFPFAWVKLTIAHHGSSTPDGQYAGNPCGFVVKMGGKTIYHAGDTGLFLDMKLIGEMNPLDLALLPIGDNFTMGIEDAVKAAEFLRPGKVIPIHYDTFDLIRSDAGDFAARVKKLGIESQVLPLNEAVTV